MTASETEIVGLLTSYAAALQATDPDAVLMAQESPPARVAVAVRRAYALLFQAIALDVAFHFAEKFVELTPQWAFACTTSNCSIKFIVNGAIIPEANQELFIFKKADAKWRVARYAFSATSPPPKQ